VSSVTTSVSYASINGLAGGSVSFGRETLSIATRPDASGIATRITTNPDGTGSVQTTTHGLLTSAEEKSTTGGTITASTYTYDDHQRPLTVTHARTGATTYSGHTES